MNHIETKDKMDSISKIIGDFFADTKQKLSLANAEFLSQHLDYSIDDWYKSRNIHLNSFLRSTNQLINQDRKQAIKSIVEGLKEFKLSQEDITSIKKEISKGYDDLIKQSNQSIKKEIPKIWGSSKVALKVLKSEPMEALRKTITDYLNKNELGYVDYTDSNGNVVRQVKWENWMEMTVRTELQQDATKTLINIGRDTGAIFYICNFLGDCAPDHVEMQGRIFVDKAWRSNAPEDKIEDIENYISYHNILTIQEVSENKPYLTTRPNCRHFFQYIALEDVLDIKNKDQLNDFRRENNLNFNGKYKPEKYEALSKQRYNERKIRELKGKAERAETLGNKDDKLKYDRKVKQAQAEQRDLLKNNSFLERNYDREAYRRMITNLRIK